MSYEKYPEIIELIGGIFLGILNLKLLRIFSIIFLGGPFILTFFFKESILNAWLLLNSQILSGSFPNIVYLPLILPFSTDSKTKLFFSFKKLLIKLIKNFSLLIFMAEYITWLIFFYEISNFTFG